MVELAHPPRELLLSNGFVKPQEVAAGHVHIPHRCRNPGVLRATFRPLLGDRFVGFAAFLQVQPDVVIIIWKRQSYFAEKSLTLRNHKVLKEKNSL